MRPLVLAVVAILGFSAPSLAQDANTNPVIPFFNIVGSVIQQKMQEEALKNSPDYRNQEIQPGGLTRGQVIIVQQKLIERGYDVGVPDGVVGPKTMGAVGALEQKAGMPVTGLPTAQLLQALLQ